MMMASGDGMKPLDSGGILGLPDGPKLVGQLVAGECRLPAAATPTQPILSSDHSRGGGRPLPSRGGSNSPLSNMRREVSGGSDINSPGTFPKHVPQCGSFPARFTRVRRV